MLNDVADFSLVAGEVIVVAEAVVGKLSASA